MKPDVLDDPKVRAEDIILGALGYGEDASIVHIARSNTGFVGKGVFRDGEAFDFASDEELNDLEEWALQILVQEK